VDANLLTQPEPNLHWQLMFGQGDFTRPTRPFLGLPQTRHPMSRSHVAPKLFCSRGHGNNRLRKFKLSRFSRNAKPDPLELERRNSTCFVLGTLIGSGHARLTVLARDVSPPLIRARPEAGHRQLFHLPYTDRTARRRLDSSGRKQSIAHTRDLPSPGPCWQNS